MNTSKKQKKKSLKEHALMLIKKHEKEQELGASLATTSRKIISSGLSLTSEVKKESHDNTNGVDEASLGFSIIGILMSFATFFHAVYDFMKGGPFSLPRFGKMLISGTLIILAVIGLAIPPLGAAMGLCAAVIGCVMAMTQLISHIYEKYTNGSQLKKLQAEIDHLNEEVAEDGKRLNDILSKSKGQPSPAEEEELNTALKEIEPRQIAREKKYQEIIPLYKKALIKQSKLTFSTTIERCLTIIGATLGVAAAIMSFSNPLTAGVIALAATVTSIILTGRIVFKYLMEKFSNTQKVSPLTAQPTPSMTVQNSPQLIDKKDETVETSAQLHQTETPNLSVNKEDIVSQTTSQLSFFKVTTPTPQPSDEPLSKKEEGSEEFKEPLNEMKTQETPTLSHSLFVAPNPSKTPVHEAGKDSEVVNTIERG
jgi:hypothetical protein